MSKRKAIARERGSCGVDYTPSARESPIPQAVREALLAIEGVEGVGLVGEERLRVYVSVAGVQSKLPSEIEGFAVDSLVTGQIGSLPIER